MPGRAWMIDGVSCSTQKGCAIYGESLAKVRLEDTTVRGAIGTEGPCLYASDVGEVELAGFSCTNSHSDLGGAVSLWRADSVLVRVSSFINTTSTTSAGAIHINGVANVTVHSSSWTNCSADTHGGALYLLSVDLFELVASNFTNTFAGTSGGAVYTSQVENLSIEHCHFTDAVARSDRGGAMSILSATTAIIVATFCNRCNSNTGGGMYVASEMVTIKHCYATSCASEAMGGFAHIASATLVTFEDNKALMNQAGSFGGVLSTGVVASVVCRDNMFRNNSAAISGGASYAVASVASSGNTYCWNTAGTSLPNDYQGTSDSDGCCPYLQTVHRVSSTKAGCVCVLSDADGQCVDNCPQDQYPVAQACQRCTDFGFNCTNCTLDGCEASGCSELLSASSPTLCQATCPSDGFLASPSACGDCRLHHDSRCDGCNNTMCYHCDGGWLLSNACVDVCPSPGFNRSDGTCALSCAEFEFDGSCSECSESGGCLQCHGWLSVHPQQLCHSCDTFQANASCYNCSSERCLDCEGWINDTGICVAHCGDGFFGGADGLCASCDSAFSNGSRCLSCAASGCTECQMLMTPEGHCVDACPTGYFDNSTSVCVSCDLFGEPCVSCNASGCIECDGLFDGVACVVECPSGSYNTSSGMCLGCEAFASNGRLCSSCSEAYGCSLVGCADGWLSSSEPHNCGLCTAPEFNSSSGLCVSCEAFGITQLHGMPCLACTEQLGCQICDGGWLTPTVPSSCVSECPLGTYNALNGHCEPCIAFGSCTLCTPDGCTWEGCSSVLSGNPRMCELTCPQAEYPLNKTCVSCNSTFGQGCLGCSELLGCESCPSLLSLESPALCQSTCPIGQFGLDGSCQACNPVYGNCTNCTSDGGCVASGCDGVLIDSSCHAACPAGEYNPAGSSICDACPQDCAECVSKTQCTVCDAAVTARFGPICSELCSSACLSGTCVAGPFGNGSCMSKCMDGFCGDSCNKKFDK